MKLQDRVAIVTGGAQGIGLAVCEAFVAEGAKLAMVDIDPRVHEVAADLASRSGGVVEGYVCDVSDRTAVEKTAAQIQESLGTTWVLVNNAGAVRAGMMWKLTDEDWDSVMNTHLKGAWYWICAVLPGMREAKGGRIISSVSSAGINGTIGQANYAAAKAGLIGLTRSAARELAAFDICVNAVSPAAATPMTEKIRTDERFREKYMSQRPLRRWAEPDEVAPAYTFLATDDSSYMTGQVLSVDGGSVFMR
ncbi:SDR family NAD(P)-dependent oxidoreductase [Nocardioides houyundeii]|uniref:SDR family NAD(P)-dependent oxidoreductase n=1 Tax=Nocardioides houyundeii TaxID=2045452 RepID=UPI000DF3983E|nr:SDR family oxidoreductase [Nocardioides houyundeii]